MGGVIADRAGAVVLVGGKGRFEDVFGNSSAGEKKTYDTFAGSGKGIWGGKGTGTTSMSGFGQGVSALSASASAAASGLIAKKKGKESVGLEVCVCALHVCASFLCANG